MDFRTCLQCLTGASQQPQQPASASGIVTKQPVRVTEEDAAAEFIDVLRAAEKGGEDLRRRLRNVVTTASWTESFAKMILGGVETLVQHKDTVGQVVREAVDKSTELALDVFGFVEEHPVLVTIVAIGVLCIIAPWVIEALGFGELGPIAGEDLSESLVKGRC